MTATDTTTDGPRYPDVHVRLSGSDGSAVLILGKVSRALRSAGVPDAEIRAFTAEAMDGDYDALLRTAMRWVAVS